MADWGVARRRFGIRGGDPFDLEAVKKVVLASVEKTQAGGKRLPPSLKSQRDCVLEPGKLETRRAAVEDELRAACQPKLHHFDIISK